jgi:hypothetical protein
MIEYTVKVHESGDKLWYLNGKMHREDGPAIENANGDNHWCLDGKRHREDGPAIETANGYKAWYLKGNRHREDGAAVEWANGYKAWYLDGKELTESEFNSRMKPACAGKTVEIDGVKYKLVEAD